MKYLVFLVVAFITAATVYAAEKPSTQEGFIYQGKTHVVWKDGQKVGKTFAELYPQGPSDRKPAGLMDENGYVYFFQDHNVKCYRNAGAGGAGFQCVRAY